MNLIKTNDDKIRALDILEQAFTNVPGVTWMVENSHDKKKALRNLLDFCFQESADRQGAYLSSDRNGAVFFYNLKSNPLSFSSIARKLQLMLTVLGTRKSIEVMKTRMLIERHRPVHGWYGWFVGTVKDKRGVRAAYEIRRDMFRISDETRQPIYVETTVQRIRTLYERTGFHEYAKIKHPYTNADIWLMKRDPRNS